MMELEISKIPYKHRFAAASMLMSKGNRLTDLTSLATKGRDSNQIQRILQGIFYYDMALSLMKPFDPNFQTLLNWKCQALISIGQYDDARRWYEELVRIATESEGVNCIGATAQLAHDQIASLVGKQNEPLPSTDELDVRMFDDPPFCVWAEQFCGLLENRKFKQAHRCLSREFGRIMTPASLKDMWSSMLGSSNEPAGISLEQFELSSEPGQQGHLGWCYFSITSADIDEAISMDVFKTDSNAYEIGSLEFGRP